MINTLTKNIPNSEKKVLIYCRESVDQNGANYERIETQRDILVNFCKRNGYNQIVDIILHDDMSGTDFGRLDDIKARIINGEINTLVLKDSSRLGRNQIEALKFIEFLEEYDVELVFESEKYDEDLFPLLSYFNERRAKEDSKKIKRVLHHKMDEASLIITAPFGYTKVGKELVIDNNVSWIIKKVFELYSEGNGYHLIAKYLNEQNIPSPSQYRNNPKMPISQWTVQSIYKIINNPIYMGKIAYHKTHKPSFKNKRVKKISRDQWMIKDGKHEPIVSQELYERVQNILKDKQTFSSKTKTKSIFSGYAVCGKCKSNMHINRRSDREDYFLCGINAKKGKEFCSTHHVTEKEIEIAFIEYFQKLSTTSYKKQIMEEIEKGKKSINNKNEINKLSLQLLKLNKQYEELYNDKLEGIIEKDFFVTKSKKILSDKNMIEMQLENINKETESIDNLEKAYDKYMLICDNISKNGLTKEGVDTIVEKIIIYEPEDITENDKLLYNINDKEYKKLQSEGGILFRLKTLFNAEYSNTIWRLDKYIRQFIK